MNHKIYIERCLQLARLGETQTAPNPMVGCVIVYNQKIVAEGYHQRFGGPHAEVNAVNALPPDVPIADCTVYVSLEPCSHYGKTPPCSDLIVKLNPKKVVVGMLDPNPQVSGRGLERIKNAGIEVVSGVLKDACADLNKKFITQHTKNRPFITLKWAETKDGFMGRPKGSSLEKQISNQRNATLTHQLRANHQAILIGRRTLQEDNPHLDTRYAAGKNPIKIILSSQRIEPSKYQALQQGQTIVYGTTGTDTETVVFNAISDLNAIAEDLFNRGIQSVLVEGGAHVLQQFINAELWDKAMVLTSPKKWQDGIKAPTLEEFTTQRTTISNGDRITLYQRI